MSLPYAFCLSVVESHLDGEEAECTYVLLVWVLPPFGAAYRVVDLAGLGSRTGRCTVLRWGLVGMLPGPAPVHGGHEEGGRSWMPDQDPAEVQFFFLIKVQRPCSI